jgi:hypothetical protein
MLDQYRWLLPLLLISAAITTGCGDSCDEEAECREAPFQGCRYEGCGDISCTLALTMGTVVCNEDGTQGCTAWPEIAEGCETMGTPKQQAGCTELLSAALVHTPSQNIVPCIDAMLEVAPCLLDEEDGPCPTEGLDAVCFDAPLECD